MRRIGLLRDGRNCHCWRCGLPGRAGFAGHGCGAGWRAAWPAVTSAARVRPPRVRCRYVYQRACRAVERHAAGRSAVSGAGVCGAGSVAAGGDCVLLAAFAAARGGCGRCLAGRALGMLLFVTEMFRDWEGRGVLFRGIGRYSATGRLGNGVVRWRCAFEIREQWRAASDAAVQADRRRRCR